MATNASGSVDIEFVLQVVVYIPLACVGVCGNGLSFWVWLGEAKKSSTTLLFMYLAVSDTAQLVCKALSVLGTHGSAGSVFAGVLLVVAELGLVISVHTTTLIAFKRWYSVWKPLHVHTVLSRRRVFVMCVVTSLRSVILVAIWSVTIYSESLSGQAFAALFVTTTVMGRIVPTLLLVICSISIVWMLVRHSRQFQQTRTTTESTAAVGQRRVTVGVLCIAACTFITFPVGFTTTLILVFDKSAMCGPTEVTCFVITTETVNILQAINCGINFIFYFTFSTTFRKLLKQRLWCVCRGLCRSRLNPPSTPPQQPESGTTPSPLQSTSDTPC